MNEIDYVINSLNNIINIFYKKMLYLNDTNVELIDILDELNLKLYTFKNIRDTLFSVKYNQYYYKIIYFLNLKFDYTNIEIKDLINNFIKIYFNFIYEKSINII